MRRNLFRKTNKEKAIKEKRSTHLLFVDLEKALDKHRVHLENFKEQRNTTRYNKRNTELMREYCDVY